MKTTILTLLILLTSSALFAQSAFTNYTPPSRIPTVEELNYIQPLITYTSCNGWDSAASFSGRIIHNTPCICGTRTCQPSIIIDGCLIPEYQLYNIPNTSIERETIEPTGTPAYMSDEDDDFSSARVSSARNTATYLYIEPKIKEPVDSTKKESNDLQDSIIILEEQVFLMDREQPIPHTTYCPFGKPQLKKLDNKLPENTDDTTWFITSDTSYSLYYTTKEVPSTKKFYLNVYPNHTSYQATISFSNEYAEPVTVEIFDISGKVLYQQINVTTDKLVVTKDDLPSGMYYVRIVKQNVTGYYEVPTARLVIY